ncbi:hypothetical protein CAPTEDRAFT_199247 [Capitella teleta]|uniref:Reverse transcriptase domain-containing protein n=1 Tax=Capitella teleta TaxID=283909 RepID=R7UKJ2_CAPTE|nr:hypothetical protein CAPTEDRAFT_199247 [Capitella teleta]|eukprot:ELU03802.1 hypothetical protein CAPTEDRAFT_199247 [Capitella teleta]
MEYNEEELPTNREKRKEAYLHHLLDIVDRESENVGLGLNTKKTVTMVISKKADTPICNLKLKDSTLVQVEKFKYLGSTIYSDGRYAQECTFALLETVQYYVQRDTPVWCMLLDAHQIFITCTIVQYTTLFRRLLQKNLCPRSCRVLLTMHTGQTVRVRWGSTTSSAFNVRNGVKSSVEL